MAELTYDYDANYCLFDLPWEDVLCRYILPYLTLSDLFKLRHACIAARDLTSFYFKKLIHVDLTHCNGRLSAEAFNAITCDNELIQKLVLLNCKDWLTDNTLANVLERCSMLKHVNVAACSRLTNATVQRLADYCQNLQCVILRNCHWLTEPSLMVLVMNCRSIRHLDLESCWDITDLAVHTVVTTCKSLEFLSLCKIYGITDASLRAIAMSGIPLNELNICGCWRVTDDSARLLAEYCKTLRLLHVSDCRDITERTLARMRVNGVRIDRPMLKYIPLHGAASADQYLGILRTRLNPQI